MVYEASSSKPKFYLLLPQSNQKIRKKDQAEAKSTRQKRKKERDDYI